MGIELELLVLFAVQTLGTSVFAAFELETPAWRKVLKWSSVLALTLSLYQAVGHWALAAPIALGALGATFHVFWCRCHAIHPLRATPRRRYYELRGWSWVV